MDIQIVRYIYLYTKRERVRVGEREKKKIEKKTLLTGD